jgi:recombination protein RecA
MFGHGISREGSLIDVAVDHGVVKKSGAWYTYDDDQLGQGRENAKRFLRENPELAMQLQARVFEAVGLVDDEDPEHEGAEATAETSVEAATPETSAED